MNDTDTIALPAGVEALAGPEQERQYRFAANPNSTWLFDRESLRHAQKMEAIGKLTAGVAHDFYNILVVIQGYASILTRKNQEPETREQLNQISAAANRGAILTRQLLSYARRKDVQFEPLDLNALIENLSQMLRRLLGEDIQLQNLHGAGLKPILGDTGMIEQVIMNLVVNAREAMPDGGTLTMRTDPVCLREDGGRPEARPGEYVCLSVADTGCGMSPEVLSHIFEPFFTTREDGRGTGLGLATVQDIVSKHSGWVEVSTQVGAGTEFRVFFPCAPNAAVRSKTRSSAAGTQPGKETILLVEDEDTVRGMTCYILRWHGYQVIEAASGTQALTIAAEKSGAIDLVLTDLVLPGGVCGVELVRRLRQARPELRAVLTSGYEPSQSGLDPQALAAARFVSKPYTPDKLVEAVQDCLANTD